LCFASRFLSGGQSLQPAQRGHLIAARFHARYDLVKRRDDDRGGVWHCHARNGNAWRFSAHLPAIQPRFILALLEILWVSPV
jgi:hypothetical protein